MDPVFTLPNVRRLFVPDKGMVIADCDLAGADAQVFAKETGDENLLNDFRLKRDIHADNARFMFGRAFTDLDPSSHAYYHKRQQCKHSVHATHNVGSYRALMRHPSINFSEQQARLFQSHWFELHPRIPEYFRRLERTLLKNRSVSNRFGYRIHYFDRIDLLLPQAIPWVNQSTVAEITLRGALRLRDTYPWIEMLMQVHDSIVFQFPVSKHEPRWIDAIRDAITVPVPYPDEPLIIPWGMKFSTQSWGDCK